MERQRHVPSSWKFPEFGASAGPQLMDPKMGRKECSWSTCQIHWSIYTLIYGPGLGLRSARVMRFLFCHATHSLSWSYQCCANALASGARFMGPVKEKLQTAMIATVFRFWCVSHPLKRPSQGPLCQDVPKLILLALLVFEKWSIAVTQCHVQSPSWSISANKPQGLWCRGTMLLVATRAYHHGYHLAFLSQCCVFWGQ